MQPARRRHRRLPLPLAAVVTPLQSGATPTRCHSVDVSASGVLLACVGVTGRVKVSLQLPDGRGRLEVFGTVVRHDPGRTAVQFTDVDRRTEAALQGLASPTALVPSGARSASASAG